MEMQSKFTWTTFKNIFVFLVLALIVIGFGFKDGVVVVSPYTIDGFTVNRVEVTLADKADAVGS